MNGNRRLGRVALVIVGVAALALAGLGVAGAGSALAQGMMGWGGMHRGYGMGGYGRGPGMMGPGMGPGMMGPGWGRGYGPGTGPGTAPGGAPSAGDAVTNPVPRTQASIAAGQATYQAQCTACHGADALGDGPVAANLFPRPANLRALAGTRTDGSLFATITYGRGPMPAFGGSLSEHQRWDVVNYLQSLAK